MAFDVVLPYRNQGREDNEELRYALRSLKFLPDVNDVWFIGDKPDWVEAKVILTPPNPNKWEELDDVWRLIANYDDLTDEVIYTEDDYFVLRPFEELPNFYFNTLEERVAKLRARGAHGGWTHSLIATLATLQRNGIPHPISFDMHIPMLVNRGEIPVHMHCDSPVRWRSLYGNVSSTRTEFLAPDVKCVNVDETQNVMESDNGFLSSNEATFESSGVASVLAKVLPDYSPYEKEFYD